MSDRATKSTGLMKAPHNTEPAVELMAPECPLELGQVARAEWQRLVPYLATKIELMPLDRGPLAIYCAAYQRWVEGIQLLEEYGTMIKTPKGYPQQSPYLSIVNREAETMMRIAGEFGFTPASRAKVFPRKSQEWDL